MFCETRADEVLVHAASVLGFESRQCEFQDQRLDESALVDIIQEVEIAITEWAPEIVYTHWSGDLNRDHRIVSEAVDVACRPKPESSVKLLLQGEVSSSTEWAGGFNPTWFETLTDELWERKVAALFCYEEEMRPFPHARSFPAIDALGRYRGATVGARWAEAFEVRRVMR